jgi:hypothetical protein
VYLAISTLPDDVMTWENKLEHYSEGAEGPARPDRSKAFKRKLRKNLFFKKKDTVICIVQVEILETLSHHIKDRKSWHQVCVS